MNKIQHRLIVLFSLAALLFSAAGLSAVQAAAAVPAALPIPMDAPPTVAETQGSRAPIFSEDFSAGIPPAGWTITNNGGNCVWSDDDLDSSPDGNQTGGTGKFADADSDNCGIGTTMNTTLLSPPINLSSAPFGTTLRFQHYYSDYSGQSGSVEIRPTLTASWTTLQTFSGSNASGEVEIDITPYLGNSDARIRFNFISPTWGWYWQIDDVGIYEPAPELTGTLNSNPVIAAYNDLISYNFHLVNDGNMASTATGVSVPLPTGTSYIVDSVTCSSGTCSFNSGTNRVEWVGSVPPGGSAVDLGFTIQDTLGICRVIETNALITDISLPEGLTITNQTSVVPQRYEDWDFELDNGGFIGNMDWEWGAPNYTQGPTGAHTGSNVWGTNLDASYTGTTSHILTRTVDLTAVNPLTGLTLTWWEWYDLANYGPTAYDQGFVKINWNHVHAIRGNSNGEWIERSIDLTPYAGQTIELMFYLDASYGGSPGWYIDDLVIHAACPSAQLDPNSQSIYVCPASDSWIGYDLINRTGITETFTFSVTSSPFSPIFAPITVTVPSPDNYNGGSVYFHVPEDTSKGYTDIFTITATGQNSGMVAVSTVESTVGPSWDNVWSDIPYNIYSGAFIGYEGQGYLIASSNDLLRFDPTANSWSDLAVRPGSNYDVSDVCLGRDSNGHPTITVFPTNSNLIAEIYDIWNNSWYTVTLSAPYPTYGLENFDVVSDFENNRCYISGGYGFNGSFYEIQSALYQYNPENHTVNLLNNLTTPRMHHASWLMEDTTGTYVCVAGGTNVPTLNGINSTQCYDLGNATMQPQNSTIGALPYPVLMAADAEKLWYGQRQLWLIGGIDNPPSLNSGGQIQEIVYPNAIYWDPVNHTWVQDSTLYQAAHNFEADVLDSQIYTAGGSYYDDLGYLNTISTVQRHTQCNLPLPETPSLSVKDGTSSRFSGADILQMTHDGPAIAINAPTLGLVGADDISSLSYGHDYYAEPFPLQFSVVPGATGLAGTAVSQQSACATAETAADEYGVKYPGTNIIVYDENGFPCSGEPVEQPIGFELGEDLDALVNQPPTFIDWELDGELNAPVYFSLAPGSPSLTGGLTSADILVFSETLSSPMLYASHTMLGLQSTDVIDALLLGENGTSGYQRANWENWGGDVIIFSLAAGSPSLSSYGFNPGDLLVPSKYLTGTVPMRAYPAELLGLTPTDDVDALKGIDWHLWDLAPYPEPRGPLANPSPCTPAGTGGIENWEWLPALPLQRAFGFAAIAGDWLYVGNGESVYGEDTYAFAFDRNAQEWYSITPPPIARTQTAAVCAEPTPGNGKIYVIGGAYNLDTAGEPTPSDDVLVYNPQTDTWIEKAPMPTARAGLGLAWDSVNNRIFAVGGDQIVDNGSESLPTDILEIYNVASNSWSTAAPMPVALQYIQATIYYTPTQKLYVFGGTDGNTVSDVVYVYNAVTNQWTTLPTPMPAAAFGAVAGFCNGNIHVIGGYDGSTDLVSNRVFDPATETWLPNAIEMPDPRTGMMSSAISTGKEIYIAGGVYSATQQIDLWRYTCDDTQSFAYIGDYVWHDLNGDGIQGENEPGLENVTVALMLPDNTEFMTTTTGVNGDYLFTVPPDHYYLKITPPTNFVFTLPDQGGDDTADSDFDATGTSPIFSAIEGESLDWDAGLFRYASVSGMKYEDRNGNGTRDTGEPGLPNWVIWLDCDCATLPVSTTTTVTGDFTFDNVPPGGYTLGETLPNDWVQTQPGGSGVYTFTLTSGQSLPAQDFGNYAQPTLTVSKYHDLNGNGTHDINEPGLPDWAILLSDGEITYTLHTDTNGEVLFDWLPPGTYTIHEELLDGWAQTQPGDPDYYEVTLTSGVNLARAFGNFTYGSIEGAKFEDMNGNGQYDTSEPFIEGWLITATYSSPFWGNGILTTTTDNNGIYFFGNLPPGIYVIEEDLPENWYQTLPGSPAEPDVYTLVLHSGDALTDNDFGNYLGGSIEGYKFNDLNNNSAWDTGEPALPDWLIYLDLNNNGRKDANEPRTQTDENGFYGFYGLKPGTYTVAEEQQPGWLQTYPANGTHIVVFQNSGDYAVEINFGNLQVSGIGDRVWLDINGNGIQEPGEPPIPQAIVTLYDANLNLLATTYTNYRGEYAFMDLAPGDYVIGFSTPGGTVFTLPDQGGDDTLDSDADRVTGLSPVITLSTSEFNDTVDAGLFRDDLFAYDFDLFTNPPSVRQGETPDVGLNLRRSNGIGTLTDIQIAFYRGDPENGGTLLGIGEIPTMTARSSITTTVQWLPAPTAGNYVLYAVIDPNDTIPETDETNNVISRTITVLPAFSEDTEPPIVTATYITPTIHLTNVPTITIGATAEDNPGGSGVAHILYAEAIYDHEVGRWVALQRTGWLPYAANRANLTWILDETPGIHFILAWAADLAGNISLRPKVNFVVYYPGATRSSNFSGYADLVGGDVHLLRLPLQAGITCTIRVTSLEGDADLYVWNPDDSPAGISENDANLNPVDEVTFTTAQTAVYQIEVEGYADFSTYQIEIELGGLRGIEDVRIPYPRPRGSPYTNSVAEPGNDVGVPSAPVDNGTGNMIYLPIVFR